MIDYTFPFGEKVNLVQQTDRTPKRVFVLGVYASAVHAAWISRDGKMIIRALAVASEPYIFWRGDHAEEIISRIRVPDELGSLTSAGTKFNGPSGRALDEFYLEPLGVDRSQTWLCDLKPHTCLNPGQLNAIRLKYDTIRNRHSLPEVTVPKVPTRFADGNRQREILSEIQLADAKLIILLGDQPIKWFLNGFSEYRSLSEFGKSSIKYGMVHPIELDGKSYNVLPLVHPRQAGALSSHSVGWTTLHREWMENRAKEVSRRYLSE